MAYSIANSAGCVIVVCVSCVSDSALCAAIAVDALSAARVHCVMLPYRFTSNESLNDAAACAQARRTWEDESRAVEFGDAQTVVRLSTVNGPVSIRALGASATISMLLRKVTIASSCAYY